MNVFFNYAWEIFEIAGKNNVTVDVGSDMFKKNLDNAGKSGYPYYEGTGSVDYLKLKKDIKWDSKTDHEKQQERVDFENFMKEHYVESTTAFRNGDKNSFNAIFN